MSTARKPKDVQLDKQDKDNEDEVSRIKLLDLLIADRNHHFDHPQQVLKAILITLITGTVTVLAAIIALAGTGVKIKSDPWAEFFCTASLVLGGIFGLVGLLLHNERHKEQRIRVEDAIDDLLHGKSVEKVLSDDQKISAHRRVGLLVAEPDRNVVYKQHDTYFISGAMFFIVFMCISMALIRNYSKNANDNQNQASSKEQKLSDAKTAQ